MKTKLGGEYCTEIKISIYTWVGSLRRARSSEENDGIAPDEGAEYVEAGVVPILPSDKYLAPLVMPA